MDELRIRIAETGDIIVESDEVSQGNHMNAEAFLRFVEQEMGTVGKRTKLPQSHVHAHEHQHA